MLREKRHALAPSGRVEPNTLPTVGIRCRVGDGRSEAAPLEQLVVEQKSARTSRGIAVNLEVPRSAIEGVPCEHLPLDGVGWSGCVQCVGDLRRFINGAAVGEGAHELAVHEMR